jgi:hypothetical protein
MDVWGWIVVYAVGLTLLQLLVYRYLLNNGGSLTRRVGTPFGDGDRETSFSNASSGSNSPSRRNGSAPRPGEVDAGADSGPATAATDRRSRDPPASPDRADPDTPRGRRCPHCGAENEADDAFSFCWNCAREL